MKETDGWEIFGYGDKDETAKAWGIPVEALDEEKEDFLGDLTEEEQQKLINIFFEFGKELDSIVETISSGKMGEGDLEDVITS